MSLLIYRRYIVLFLGVWAASEARATDFAAAFLEMGAGGRGVGLGGAFAAAADDASATYWNPAGLVQNRGWQVQVDLQPLSLDRRQNSASVAFNARGELAFGFTWLHAGVGAIEGRAGNGVRTGAIEDAENAFCVAMAHALGSRLALGLAMKVIDQRLEVPARKAATAHGHGFDLGLQFRLSQRMALAMVARNLRAGLDWKVPTLSQQTSTTRDDLSRVLVFGLAHRPFADLLLTADLNWTDEVQLNAGIEWIATPLLAVRGGASRLGRDRSLVAGLTLRPMQREAVQFHYAYATDPLEAGNRLLFGLGLSF